VRALLQFEHDAGDAKRLLGDGANVEHVYLRAKLAIAYWKGPAMNRYRLVLGGVVQAHTVEADAAPPLHSNKGFWARETDTPPSYDPATETRSGPVWTITPPKGATEGSVEAVYTVSALPVETVKAEKKAAIVAKLAATDAGMARVVEELAEGVSLSPEAKARIDERKALCLELAALE